MAYCTKSNVEAYNTEKGYSNESMPNSFDVEKLIANVAALMDGRLGAIGFTVPITGSISLAIVKTINVLGAAAMAENAAYAGEKISKYSELLWERYEAEMKRIEANPQILSDAIFSPSSSTHPGSNLSSLHQDYPDTAGLDARFEMAEKW